MRALIRVDGGLAVGMGHVVRCHALGQALASLGCECLYLTAADAARAWLQREGLAVERLSDAPASDGDARATLRRAEEWGASCIVTDGYNFREAYLQALSDAGARLVSIDDLAAWPFPCAVVVNGGLRAKQLRYATSPSTRLLLGPEYLLLRPAFRGPRRRAATQRPRVLALFGGADPGDWSRLALEAWAQLPEVSLDLVVGAAYPWPERLSGLPSRPGVAVHRDLAATALATLMTEADLALAASGMVACELAALGVPMLLAVASEDQRANAEALVAAGAARRLDTLSVEGIVGAVRRLLADAGACERMGARAAALVDGRGGERVAEVVRGLAG